MTIISKGILSILDQIFNKKTCLKIAYSNKFISRSSSLLKGHEFAKVLILPSEGVNSDSLAGICDRLKKFNPSADISASALAQRINTPSSVAFIKEIFGHLLQICRTQFAKKNNQFEKAFKYFKNVLIQDSTLIELNQIHKKKYPGTKRGKNCCKSQMKIDVIHNYSTGQIIDLKIGAGKNPDQSLAKRINQFINKGDLIIRDLGYFAVDRILEIENKGAYYLSRLPSHVTVYLKQADEAPIDLARYLDKNYPGAAVIDLQEVYISAKKIKTRLVIYKVPKDVYEQRRRRANKHSKETGRQESKAKSNLMKFSIFVTNVEKVKLSKELVGTIYRLRWEIELIFKRWKSQLKIHYLKGTNKHRVNCLMWGRLCMVIIVAMLSASFMNLTKEMFKRELSTKKFLDYLLREGKLCWALANSKLSELEENVIEDISWMMKDKRNRKTLLEKVMAFEEYYEGI